MASKFSNDYSRFDDIVDSDDELSAEQIAEEKRKALQVASLREQARSQEQQGGGGGGGAGPGDMPEDVQRAALDMQRAQASGDAGAILAATATMRSVMERHPELRHAVEQHARKTGELGALGTLGSSAPAPAQRRAQPAASTPDALKSQMKSAMGGLGDTHAALSSQLDMLTQLEAMGPAGAEQMAQFMLAQGASQEDVMAAMGGDAAAMKRLAAQQLSAAGAGAAMDEEMEAQLRRVEEFTGPDGELAQKGAGGSGGSSGSSTSPTSVAAQQQKQQQQKQQQKQKQQHVTAEGGGPLRGPPSAAKQRADALRKRLQGLHAAKEAAASKAAAAQLQIERAQSALAKTEALKTKQAAVVDAAALAAGAALADEEDDTKKAEETSAAKKRKKKADQKKKKKAAAEAAEVAGAGEGEGEGGAKGPAAGPSPAAAAAVTATTTADAAPTAGSAPASTVAAAPPPPTATAPPPPTATAPPPTPPTPPLTDAAAPVYELTLTRRALQVVVELPHCQGMAGVDLSVSASALQLDATAAAGGRPCRLSIALPVRVDSAAVAAKFSTQKHRLKLTMPLETPAPEPRAAAAATAAAATAAVAAVAGAAAPPAAAAAAAAATATATAAAPSRTVHRLPGLATTFTVLRRGCAGDDAARTVARGDEVVVHAVGVVKESGKRFWSTRDAGAEPFEYAAGVGGVIRGWDQGCMGMRQGETRQLLIPPTEGYGREGFPRWGIPPNATLDFTIEVLQIHKSGAH